MNKIIAFFRKITARKKQLQLQSLNGSEHSLKIVSRKYKADVALTFNGTRIAKFPVSITATNSRAAKNEIAYKLGFEIIQVKQAK
jgi:hypothetical protein